jgi:DNA repair protein RadC
MTKITITELVAQLHDIADLKQEHFICFSLNSARQLIAKRTVFIGTLTGVLAHPREVYADPLADRAAAIIIAHNHPSGDVQPSKQDISMTQQLMAAGQILGVPLDDHIIVGGKKHFSFRKQGLISPDIYVAEEGSAHEWLRN